MTQLTPNNRKRGKKIPTGGNSRTGAHPDADVEAIAMDEYRVAHHWLQSTSSSWRFSEKAAYPFGSPLVWVPAQDLRLPANRRTSA